MINQDQLPRTRRTSTTETSPLLHVKTSVLEKRSSKPSAARHRKTTVRHRKTNTMHCTRFPTLCPHRGGKRRMSSLLSMFPLHSLVWYIKSSCLIIQFYYEQQIKRELKKIHICGCRCNDRLKAKTDGSTRLTYVLIVYYEAIKRELYRRHI